VAAIGLHEDVFNSRTTFMDALAKFHTDMGTTLRCHASPCPCFGPPLPPKLHLCACTLLACMWCALVLSRAPSSWGLVAQGLAWMRLTGTTLGAPFR